jgi:aspartyl protease family protein
LERSRSDADSHRLSRHLGGALRHTIVWLVLMAVVGGFFYRYLSNDLNPNRFPHVTGTGEIVLKRNRAGHFVAAGAINGQPVTFLVDTGATQITIPRELADKLDLERGTPTQLMTAAGPAQGYLTKLAKVDLASLHLEDANATVAEGLDPGIVLLGMNFLRLVEITQRGDELILTPLQLSRSSPSN